MKQLLITLTVVLSVWSAQAAGLTGDLLVHIHFAGAQKIGADPESVAFTNIFNCAEAQVLRGQTLDKLARFPRTWLKDNLAPGAVDGTDLLRPLLNDLVTSEWRLAVRDSGRKVPEFALAVRLPAGKDQVWEKNLATVLSSWTSIPSQPIAGGWELKKHVPPTTVRFEHFKDWVIFSAWEKTSPLDKQILQDGKSSTWLTVDADWQKLAKLWPALNLSDLPATHVEVTGHQGNLQLNGRAIFAGPAPIALEAWKSPFNTIQGSFDTFTAVRGFLPWLRQQSWDPAYDLTPTPNQFFAWAIPQVPFLSFLAVPVPDAGQALGQAFARLNPVVKDGDARRAFITPLLLLQTNDEISVVGAPPFISPFVTTLKDPAGQFLLAGLFTKPTRSKPFPPPLQAELGKTNLVFYHWELTSQRLPQMLQISQLGLMMTRHKQLNSTSAAAKWINRIGPALGPTTTEVVLTGPGELSGVRAAPAGLTAVELYALANWLEATNFPGCDLSMPMGKRRPHVQPVPGNMPVLPAPSH